MRTIIYRLGLADDAPTVTHQTKHEPPGLHEDVIFDELKDSTGSNWQVVAKKHHIGAATVTVILKPMPSIERKEKE